MKFKDIIKNQIEIPLIQRDYVQGLDKKKAKRFLEAIKNGIDNDGLNLDFIYGNEKDNKFIPIDGQQRLTTLFLLHYYLSLEDEYIEELQNFSYAIRPSSKEFFKSLTKKENWKKLTKTNLVEDIKNSNWYFLSWENDLTIKSALKILEMIEEEFKNYKLSNLEKIEFEFLNLEEYSLNEDLYIKMNARGKQLSDFENFKADFEEKFIADPYIRAKLDNEWLDVFWKLANEEYKKVDEFYYNFFYNTTFNFYGEKFDANKNFLKEKELLDFYNKVYEKKENVEKVIKLLDNINQYSKLKEYCEIKSNPEYYKRLDFYIWSLGILKEFDNIQMQRWQRVANNLINNTRIEDIETFTKALRGVLKLSETIQKDVYNEIDLSNVDGINKEQVKEEELKIKLIKENNNWEEEIIKAENHWYLNGQIGFLLDFAKNNLEEFKKYSKKFIILFDDKVKEDKKSQTLIQRALLTLEDYLPSHDWRKKTFCSFDTRLRIKNENWRRVFNKDCFKELLDKINKFEDLKNLIDSYKFDYDDWKSYFINPKEDWSVLENTKNYQIVFENEEKIYLNAGNTTPDKWGWRNAKELYTWYIFKKLFSLKKKEDRKIWWRKEADVDENIFGVVYYLDTVFTSGEVGIYIEKDNKEFQIYKNEKSKKIAIWDYEKEEYITTLSIQEILNGDVDLKKEVKKLLNPPQ